MLYLIQEGLYQDSHERKLINALSSMKLEYETISIKPFIDDIEFKSTRNDILIFGSVKASHLAKKYNWKPGSFYNDNHDYTVYSEYYKHNMLNYNCIIQPVSDDININGPFFARPTGDTKLFKGGVYNNIEEWEIDKSYFLSNKPSNELIQIAPLKNILQEYRCFIVKGKVITSSMYKLGNRPLYKECIDDDIIDYATKMCEIYQPSDAFVMDICRLDDGLKIIEINCINCSGFYDINIQKLIVSLQQNF